MKMCIECGARHSDMIGFDCPTCGTLGALECLIHCRECGAELVSSDILMIGRTRKKRLYCPDCYQERMGLLNEISKTALLPKGRAFHLSRV